MDNKSVFSLVNSAVNVTLPAFAAERRAAVLLLGVRRPPLSINISCSHGAQQQSRGTPLLRSNDGTEKRTDGRTPNRYTDYVPHNMRPVPIIVVSHA